MKQIRLKTFRPWLPHFMWIAWACFLAGIRYAIFTQNPWAKIVSDENSYRFMAYSFATTGSTSFSNALQFGPYPAPLYPMLLSLGHHFSNLDFFHWLIGLNVLLAFLIPICAYWVARFFLQPKTAGWLSALVALLPCLEMSAFAMPEILYYLLLLVCLGFVQSQSKRGSMGLGLFLGLLYCTKPHALTLILALILFRSDRMRWMLSFLGTVFLIKFGIDGTALYSSLHPPSHSLSIWGAYTDTVRDFISLHSIFYRFPALLALLFGFLMSSAFFFWPVYFSKLKTPDHRLHYRVTLSAFLFTLLLAVKATTDSGEFDKLHIRYITPFFAPLTLLLGTVDWKKLKSHFSKPIYLLGMLGINSVLAGVFFLQFYRKSGHTFTNLNPEMSWTLLLSSGVVLTLLFWPTFFVLLSKKIKTQTSFALLFMIPLGCFFALSNLKLFSAHAEGYALVNETYAQISTCLKHEIQENDGRNPVSILIPETPASYLNSLQAALFRWDANIQEIIRYSSELDLNSLSDRSTVIVQSIPDAPVRLKLKKSWKLLEQTPYCLRLQRLKSKADP